MTATSSQDSKEQRLRRARAHPVRAQVLGILERRAASPKELSREVGMPLGVVAYHVRVLRSLELIRLVGVRQQRGALEHRYTAMPPRRSDR
jgi:predicted transcriptional regulator